LKRNTRWWLGLLFVGGLCPGLAVRGNAVQNARVAGGQRQRGQQPLVLAPASASSGGSRNCGPTLTLPLEPLEYGVFGV